MEKEKRKPIGYLPPGCKETNRHKKTSSRMRGGQSNLNVFLLAKSNANNYRDRLSTGYHIRLISPFINSSFTLQRYKIKKKCCYTFCG